MSAPMALNFRILLAQEIGSGFGVWVITSTLLWS